jgi:isopentenyl phosphate kinase
MPQDNIIDSTEIVIIKIGGSSITNKANEETLNEDAIDWFANLIASCVHTSFLHRTITTKSTIIDEEDDQSSRIEEGRKKFKFIVVHGAGSFGHHSAKRYGLQCGKAALLNDASNSSSGGSDSSSTQQERKRYQMEGLSKTRHSVQKLNAAMVGKLLDHGVNAVGISPGISIPGMRSYGSSITSNKNVDEDSSNSSVAAMELLCESIHQSLDAGLLPVIHGDACLLDETHAGILGGDTLVEGLVGSKKMKESIHKVIFITDVAGVFTSDPKTNDDAKLIRSLRVDMTTGEVTSDEDTLAEMDIGGSSHAHDVTGGLKAKLGSAVTAVQCGKDVIIAKCCSKSAEKFVQGSSCSEAGTVISRKL